MSSYANVEINIFSLVLLAIIIVNMYSRTREYLPDQKLFFYICFSVAVIIILDSAQWLCDGHPGLLIYYVNYISNTFYYALQMLPYLLWCLYVRYKIKMDIKETLKAKWLLLIPFFINILLTIITCFNGLFFYIDSRNYYHRGDYFWISVVMTYSYFIYALLYLFLNRRKTERDIFTSLIVFTLPPLIGSIIQVFHFGIALIWPGISVSLLIIYINIQKNQLYTDHLTGLYNRRLLDMHLDECLKNNYKHDRIGVLMLDIDDFKQINDAYGHLAGDQALVDTAGILKKSGGKGAFIARYGGDEFVVIAPACDISELERIAEEIEKNIEAFNKQDSAMYTVHLSIGYEVFECSGNLSKFDVLARIDKQMYEKKFKDGILQDQIRI
ncbi:MAG: diguanylate cyclase [Oscillospiraceae bacterium]|nr:diguanylate cyclase [Oscillospiraceae bacterium]